MPSLDAYLFALDPAPDEILVASGLTALDLTTAGTGTCGVTTQGVGVLLPVPGLTGAGSWSPLGVCPLPTPLALANGNGWHPAWGAVVMPLAGSVGTGSIPALAQAVLPPLFALTRSGATGGVSVGLAMTAVSDLGRSAQGALRLPPASPRGHVCSINSPAGGVAVASDAVVALLGQGDAELAEAVAGLPAGNPDAAAAALLALVAGRISYVADDADDAWTCAAATLARGSGDCEDGALLLHALLLAAGLPADRIVTAFGRVGVDRAGHAWVAWRRVADGQWVALDWTLGAQQGAVAGLPVLGDPGPYAWVDYAVTAGAFFTVRQPTDVFFARAHGDGVALPRLAAAAAASLAALGAAAMPADWAAWGLGAASGLANLARPGLTATGRFSWGQARIAPLGCLGGVAATAADTLAGLTATALAGGGGWAAMRLPFLLGAGLGFSAALLDGACPLTRLAGAGRGLAGGLGLAHCLAPGLRPTGCALPGQTGQGGTVLPLIQPLGLGRDHSLGNAAADLDRWSAAGWSRTTDNQTRGRRGNGEEWA
ncbi:transglutaminase domain-containing protein [Desulfovibrio aerotolerans]|uniref:Transglutaminase domain-containing protein n=1 Tax=Solidesulfovibrio aerotolerans TaxID=295255 RepID=A0A7C9IMU3_9BACT|nr:transglutaminase domain-containing protein [Solidesulfovibrio aerotolerans]MYL84861.1 transglutaminase domain-containing protein [Solidesulfovibrio aerotolerans]